MLNINSLDSISEYSDGSIIMLNPSNFGNSISAENITQCLINMLDAFELINNIGKTILSYILTHDSYKNRIDIYDIIIDIIDDTRPKCFNDYEKWINENVYPYSYKSFRENGNYSISQFLYDCTLLTIYNEIHIWALKFKNNYGISNRLYKLLNILNLSTNVLNDYDISPEDIKLAIPDPNKNFDDNTPLFNNLVRLLLKLITDKANNYEFQITKQTPYYNEKKGIYHLYNKANSVMGIAYYQLLLNITSINYKYQKICLNPSCINFVTINKNNRYCDECRDNKIPEILKNRRYNNSKKGKTKRHERYIIITEEKKKAAQNAAKNK